MWHLWQNYKTRTSSRNIELRRLKQYTIDVNNRADRLLIVLTALTSNKPICLSERKTKEWRVPRKVLHLP